MQFELDRSINRGFFCFSYSLGSAIMFYFIANVPSDCYLQARSEQFFTIASLGVKL